MTELKTGTKNCHKKLAQNDEKFFDAGIIKEHQALFHN